MLVSESQYQTFITGYMHNILGTYVTGPGTSITGPGTSITEHFSINLCAFPGTWTFIGMYVGYKGSMLLKISNMQDSGQDRNFEFEGNFKGGPISQESCWHFD